MAVTDEIKAEAGNLEQFKQWRSWLQNMTLIGYAYHGGEARRYYKHENGRYYYIAVTEAEMHRRA